MTKMQNFLKMLMTRLIYSFLFILLTLSAFSDEDWTLVVDGRVTADNKRLQGAVVSLMKNTRIIQEIVTLGNGQFAFVLSPDNEYVIEVSKEGYLSKSIYFSTRNVPDDIFYTLLDPEFPVEIMMFREIDGLNTSVLDNPVGRIVYSPKLDDFGVDKAYAKQIKSELQQLYKDMKSGRKEMAKNAEQYPDAGVDSFSDVQFMDVNNAKIKEIVISAERVETSQLDAKMGARLITGLALLNLERKQIKEQLKDVPGSLVSVETFFEGRKEILIRIINKATTNIEYKCVTQPWGSRFYFKDGASITQHIFQLESDVEELFKSKPYKF